MVSEVILTDISEDREALIQELYESAFPGVARFVRKMNGNLEDAKDVFHDAIIIFYEKVRDGKIAIHISNEAYILGIAKHLWIRKFKKDKEKIGLEIAEKEIEMPEDYFQDDSHRLTLLQFIGQAGKKCLDLLQAFYYEKLPMEELSRIFGYSTIRSATVQKYKCLEKVRDKVRKNSINYEDFAE